MNKNKRLYLGIFAGFCLVVTACVGVDDAHLSDDLIGADWRDDRIGFPIRQHIAIDVGDPILSLRDGTVLATTKIALYVRYVDLNFNRRFDKETDEVIYRVPRSDPPFYYKLDPNNPMHFFVIGGCRAKGHFAYCPDHSEETTHFLEVSNG